jgi:CHAD domain-containing protein
VLPEDLAARFRPGFKWLGDLTTPTRDLDVYLVGYEAMAAGLVAATPAELQPFRTYLRRRRYAARRRLVRGLRSERFAGLLADWRAALSELTAPDQGPAAAEFAAARIARAHRKVLRLGRAITQDSPPDSLHDLRKRCKELRYLLEFFAPLHDPAVHSKAVKQLKGLQDCLGEFQDGQVQQQEIRAIAAAMRDRPGTPVTALLAMGEVASQVAAGQHAARHEFAGRFAGFAAAGTRHRFRALTAAAAT